ncbi:hypothetical protein DPMN_036515 [Dreissena polymorpha]|uniref:Uncharacterized protein n=1 Tax=Dreissena polymorpha TaxID=45954 RepID=A0A9D4RN60_DREPO|nr:hypothetical protein DPMN_036515 [Dreissena polymorpha]
MDYFFLDQATGAVSVRRNLVRDPFLSEYLVMLDGLKCDGLPFQCWNRIFKAFANSLDPDETPQNMASHQDPNCLLV